MDAIVEQLVAHAFHSRWDRPPFQIVHECKRRVIDTLGCAIAAFDSEPARIARGLASRVDAPDGARILGTQHRTLPELATFANGVMARYLDGNDVYPGGGGHPSDVISAVLALADSAAIGGRPALNAIALGYDVHYALFHGLRIFEKGFDHPFYTALSTSIAACRILRLDKKQTANAISLAVTPNLALGVTRRGNLSMWKGVASGNAARNGVFAALLAGAGMTGPDRPFQGALGLKNIVPEVALPALSDTDQTFRILRADTKYYVTEFHSEAPIMMALKLRGKIDIEFIEKIAIATYKFAYEEIGSGPEKWRPTTRETADHSMPYIVAAVLVDGKFADDIFEPAHFTDPRILAVADKITIIEDPNLTRQLPARFPCRLDIHLKDGTVKSASMPYPRGHHDDPMLDDEVSEKFRKLASRTLRAEQVEIALICLWQTDELASVRDIFDLFAIKRP